MYIYVRGQNLLAFDFNYSLRTLFTGFAGCGVFILVVSLCLWPTRAFVPLTAKIMLSFDEHGVTGVEGLLDDMDGVQVSATQEILDEEEEPKYGVFNYTHLSFKKALVHPVYYWGVFFTAFNVYRLNMYVGTVFEQVAKLSPSTKTTSDYVDVFGWILALSQIAAIPLVVCQHFPLSLDVAAP